MDEIIIDDKYIAVLKELLASSQLAAKRAQTLIAQFQVAEANVITQAALTAKIMGIPDAEWDAKQWTLDVKEKKFIRAVVP